MRRTVIDTNCLGHGDLENYLGEARDNKGLISQVTMIEIHKDAAIDITRKLMAIACRYPRQIEILQDESDLTCMSGGTRRLARRLIDPVQTAQFGAYCETVIQAPVDAEIQAQFQALQAQSQGYIADTSRRAANLFNLYRLAEQAFTESDLRHLRKRDSFPGDLQLKLVDFAFAVRAVLIRGGAEPASAFPTVTGEVINTVLFRYSLLVALYFARWVKTGKTDITNPSRLTNQLLDFKIAAVATFFDGLLTKEPALAELFGEAVVVAGAMGGYVRCGQSPILRAVP
ncbi:hypothetical protein DMC25_23160 [Caulobacter sp. D4A]|nr:hypothetical protein DMC25_23160 [Caulobacter sp. D4A]PXA96153.1 hypothetical protein DMC18_02170 [Caulobacter sp. D5]